MYSGNDYLEGIHSYIHREDIPEFLGGPCSVICRLCKCNMYFM